MPYYGGYVLEELQKAIDATEDTLKSAVTGSSDDGFPSSGVYISAVDAAYAAC